jgi:hypothetical protein
LLTVSAGDHWSLRMSRQMAPLLLMLGWYTCGAHVCVCQRCACYVC